MAHHLVLFLRNFCQVDKVRTSGKNRVFLSHLNFERLCDMCVTYTCVLIFTSSITDLLTDDNQRNAK
jgi:hypothetical protein